MKRFLARLIDILITFAVSIIIDYVIHQFVDFGLSTSILIVWIIVNGGYTWYFLSKKSRTFGARIARLETM